MDRKNVNGKNNIFLRFISVFMIVVLLVGVLPVEVKADETDTVSVVCAFNYREDEEDIDEVLDRFYVYDVDNDVKYNFSKAYKEDGTVMDSWLEEGAFWYMRVDIPKGIHWIFYSADGVNCYEDEEGDGFSNLSCLYTLNFYDDEELLDEIYCFSAFGGGDVTEQLTIKPEKLGYVFRGWVDESGDNIEFPINPKEHLVWEYMLDMNVYAQWEEHIHIWDDSTLRYDETAHWHECVGEGTCDITDNSEKDGYEVHEMGEWTEVTAATIYADGLEVRKCKGCDYEEEREIDYMFNIIIRLIYHDIEEKFEEKVTLFYSLDMETGKKYPFEKRQSLSGYWYMYVDVPRSSEMVIQTTQGVIFDRVSTLTGGPAYNNFLYTVNFNDGEEKLDTIYTWYKDGFGDITEDLVQAPEKLGYEFIGWTDAAGNDVTFPITTSYTSGWQNYQLNIYAKWTEHEHRFGEDWEYDEECHYHACVECGKHQEDLIHEMGEWVEATPANFREDGLEERKCTSCDYKQTRRIPKLSESHIHDYSGREEVVQKPTCTEEGLKKVYCTETECGASIEVPVMMTEHTYGSEWECDDDAHYRICEMCGKRSDEHEHRFGDGVIVKEATENEDGLMEWECDDCGYTISKAIKYVAPEPPKEEPTIKPEEPNEEETPIESTEKEELVVKNEPNEEKVPYTGDISSVQMYATLAMIAGFTYVLIMFTSDLFGMTEKTKEHIIKKLIRWGKGKNVMIRGVAITIMFVVLVYYHAIGKKLDDKEYEMIKNI